MSKKILITDLSTQLYLIKGVRSASISTARQGNHYRRRFLVTCAKIMPLHADAQIKDIGSPN